MATELLVRTSFHLISCHSKQSPLSTPNTAKAKDNQGWASYRSTFDAAVAFGDATDQQKLDFERFVLTKIPLLRNQVATAIGKHQLALQQNGFPVEAQRLGEAYAMVMAGQRLPRSVPPEVEMAMNASRRSRASQGPVIRLGDPGSQAGSGTRRGCCQIG